MNLEEIGKKIENTLTDVEQIPGKISLFAANEAKVVIIERLFTDGGSKDAKGQKLKPYTEKYAAKREEMRLQTDDKDLQVTGELLRSVDVGTKNDEIVLGITTERSKLIAEGQEKQNDSPIFILSDTERAGVVEHAKEELFLNLAKITDQWR